MKSIGNKIKQLEGLLDSDLTPWENSFVLSILEHTVQGTHTTGLSEKQIEIINNIYGHHFAD